MDSETQIESNAEKIITNATYEELTVFIAGIFHLKITIHYKVGYNVTIGSFNFRIL